MYLLSIVFRASVVEQYFGGTLDVQLVCAEAEEPPTRANETFLQLSCFISQDVKYLQSGLRSVSVVIYSLEHFFYIYCHK